MIKVFHDPVHIGLVSKAVVENEVLHDALTLPAGEGL
jgi:hypothetical protein